MHRKTREKQVALLLHQSKIENLGFVSKMNEEIIEEAFTAVMTDDSVEAKCIFCGEAEWIISLDPHSPLDEAFLANYYCDDCDSQ